MKDGDWNLKRPTHLIAHVFDDHSHGVDIHLSASYYRQAVERLERKLKCCGDFMRVSQGKYHVKWEKELTPH